MEETRERLPNVNWRRIRKAVCLGVPIIIVMVLAGVGINAMCFGGDKPNADDPTPAAPKKFEVKEEAMPTPKSYKYELEELKELKRREVEVWTGKVQGQIDRGKMGPELEELMVQKYGLKALKSKTKAVLDGLDESSDDDKESPQKGRVDVGATLERLRILNEASVEEIVKLNTKVDGVSTEVGKMSTRLGTVESDLGTLKGEVEKLKNVGTGVTQKEVPGKDPPGGYIFDGKVSSSDRLEDESRQSDERLVTLALVNDSGQLTDVIENVLYERYRKDPSKIVLVDDVSRGLPIREGYTSLTSAPYKLGEKPEMTEKYGRPVSTRRVFIGSDVTYVVFDDGEVKAMYNTNG